jgi:hypothetical protein
MLIRTLRPVFGQRGSALVLTMIVVVGMVALVSVASDNMFGSYKLSTINLDRQRARFAAETVAALVESKLVELASTPNVASNELDNLTKDFDATSTSIKEWWGLRGACYTDSDATYRKPTKGLWINGCSVRWRIEPVRVYAKTLDSAGAVDNAATFTINTELDPAKMLTRRSLTTNETTLSQDDPGFFHFRIVAEAYTLKEARNGDEQPWAASTATQGVEKSQVRVQAQRVVQLQVVNLFKYALFHAQEDERGDISLKTGASLTILKGSVHSNASIYICGGEWKGYTSTLRDYHLMACGDDRHNGSVESITLGSASEPIDVVGVKGIFRMSKTANLLLGVEVPARKVTGPGEVAVLDNDSTVYNLNGDSSTSTRHNINGVPFTLLKDSRTTGALETTFNRRVRDQSNGGTVVKTLANIPEMAGRPLEYQQLSSDPANFDRPLYWNAAYTAKGIDDVRDPRRATAALTVVNDADFRGGTFTGDGFDDQEAKGFYLERGLFGQGMSAPQYYRAIPDSLSRTGLVIRERPSQQPVTTASNSSLVTARPPFPAVYNPANFVAYKQDYAAYLKGQYVVLFAGRNITGYFFDTIVAATYNVNYPEQNFIVTEDEFIDNRETSWMASNYGVNPSNYIGGQSYRQNVLTLNVRAIQDFLATTVSSTIDPALDGALAKTHFNGLIYAHRTRRSKTFHIIDSPQFAWTAPTPNGSNIPFASGKYVAPAAAGIAGANYNSLTNIREGDGPYETTRCAVRIRGGLQVDSPFYPNGTQNDLIRKKYAEINWDAPANGIAGLANSGLTIVTPNRCYMWGDFNTTTHTDPTDSSKQLTVPCAVFADGITGLSANWRDSVWQDYQTWVFDDKKKTYGEWTPKYMAASTKYITSMVTNNVPTTEWNVTSFGTGGAGEMIYMVENWKYADFVFRGSMVVLNEQRYSKCGHCYMPSILTKGVGVFETGPVEFKFNTDLLTRDGQPPFSPWGFQVTRVVSTVNVFDN